MNVSTILAIIILVIIVYFIIISKPKLIKIYGHADNTVEVFLNDELITSQVDWTKRFNWEGKASVGDKIKLKVHNTGGPGGLLCTIEWDGKIFNSSSKLFGDKFNECPDNIWDSKVPLSERGNSKWIWTGDCMSSELNEFIFVLP